MNIFSWIWSWFTGPQSPADPKLVTKVQATAVTLCGFLPAAQSVLAIFTANPALASAAVVATMICQAVTSGKRAASLLGDAAPKPTVDVEGTTIVIEGEFVGR